MLIKRKNDVYLKIETNQAIAQELSDYFTFEVPGAKFMPTVRNRMWDGKIRLFSKQTGQIYVGLLPYIKQFCQRNDIEPEGYVEEFPWPHEYDHAKGFVESLNMPFELYDYQFDAFHKALKLRRKLFVSPTASGKSAIIYAIVRYLQLTSTNVLILVPTTSLVEQMASDFISYGWDDSHIHKIYSGHDKVSNKPITISTWQSIYKENKKFFKRYQCVIGDEAHLFKAKSLTGIMTKLEECPYRYGFTGTLDGTQTHRLVLEGLFGEVEQVTTTKALMDDDTIAKLAIDCVVLKHGEEISKQCKDFNYIDEINFLVQNKKRNQFIYNLCKTLKGNTLVLYQLVEKHGEVLNEMMQDLDKEVHFVHGGVGTDEREQIRALAEKKNNILILASYGVFSTGINIRNLHNVVFASPYKSRIKVLQSIGRGLRKSEQKDAVKLYDIADNLTYKNRKNFTLLHFQERINIYNEEEFNYKVNELNI